MDTIGNMRVEGKARSITMEDSTSLNLERGSSLYSSLVTDFLNVKYEIRSRIGQYPGLFLLLRRLRQKYQWLGVGKHTELVIEGFPRSGNTFAVAALKMAQSRPVLIAHHLHVPAQVVWAAKHSIPTLVLIRKPVNAVLSLVIRDPYILISQGLKNYIRFYNKILPYEDKYLVATFDEVIGNYGEVIERINRRFGTAFSIFEHTEENVRRCFELIEEKDRQDTGRSTVTETTVARPSEERERRKDLLKKKLEDGRLRDLIAEAEAIYHKMTWKCGLKENTSNGGHSEQKNHARS